MLTGPIPDVTEADLSNSPDHEPFTSKQAPNGFYDLKVLPDGRVVGMGTLEASEVSRLFLAKPDDTAGFNLITPNRVGGGRFSYARNTAIYLKDAALFSLDAEVPVKISGSEVVDAFWLSENEQKVFFIANSTVLRTFNEERQGYDSVERNQLFMVDLATGVRVQFGNTNSHHYVTYTTDDRISPFSHSARPRLLPDESRVVYVVSSEESGQIELRSANIDGTNDRVLNDNEIDTAQFWDSFRGGFIYAVAPDSSKVIYKTMSVDGDELYSVTPVGEGHIKIAAAEMSQDKSDIKITADSSRLLFLGDNGVTTDLYSVQLDGANLIN